MAREPGEPQDTPEEAASLRDLIQGPPPGPQARSAADALFAPQPDQAQSQSTQDSFGIKLGMPSVGAPLSEADKARSKANIMANHAPVGKAIAKREAALAPVMKDFAEIPSSTREQADASRAEADRLNADLIKPLQDQASKAQKDYDTAVAGRVRYREQVQSQIEAMDVMSKRIAAEQPHDIWTDASLPVKIAGIAALSLGSAAQAIWGDKTNAVADQIDAAVKRDLMLQRMRVEKNKDDYANKNLLLSRFMVEGDHIQNAEDKAYASALMGIKGRLEAMKPLLQDPKMRTSIDLQIAQLEMKSASAQERVMSNTVGYDIRQAEATALQADKLEFVKGASETASLNAQTRAKAEERMQQQHGEKQDEKQIPGWEAPNGVMASTPEVTKLREAEGSARSATSRLKTLSDDLSSGSVNFHSWSGYQQLKQDFAAITEAAKGAGLVNTGANFTKLEEDLITSGYMNKASSVIIDPVGARKLIERKIKQLWTDIGTKMAERGYRPKGHDIFKDVQ